MPVYNAFDKKNHFFSGNRINRGQFKSTTGAILNADINGSLNIMKKADVRNISLISKEYLNPRKFKIA